MPPNPTEEDITALYRSIADLSNYWLSLRLQSPEAVEHFRPQYPAQDMLAQLHHLLAEMTLLLNKHLQWPAQDVYRKAEPLCREAERCARGLEAAVEEHKTVKALGRLDERTRALAGALHRCEDVRERLGEVFESLELGFTRYAPFVSAEARSRCRMEFQGPGYTLTPFEVKQERLRDIAMCAFGAVQGQDMGLAAHALAEGEKAADELWEYTDRLATAVQELVDVQRRAARGPSKVSAIASNFDDGLCLPKLYSPPPILERRFIAGWRSPITQTPTPLAKMFTAAAKDHWITKPPLLPGLTSLSTTSKASKVPSKHWPTMRERPQPRPRSSPQRYSNFHPQAEAAGAYPTPSKSPALHRPRPWPFPHSLRPQTGLWRGELCRRTRTPTSLPAGGEPPASVRSVMGGLG
ncbi:uncharacterized protein LTR77_005252 [Saxophila tyrrhenica]|uniref:Uncharacterized protein n=1 Tax=Saxophila tyrrhenica TaxID=1690608 RepID=A0AAV9PES5_9PEZI|nr:hypothetical protein LTR77_005252 [Saxophila tyrrhenica]